LKHFFDIITIMPEMFDGFLADGVVSRAFKQDIINLNIINPRQFSKDTHNTIDDRPYGGGAGMLMMPEPLVSSINKAKSRQKAEGVKKSKVIFLSPKGKKFNHNLAKTLSEEKGLIFLSGRYEGIDQRVVDHWVDLEVSIGDYVLSGGEIPAMVVIDAVSRLIPGVLNKNESAENDSFFNGLLDHQSFTRPEVYENIAVPEVLLSGDHNKIDIWRLKNALYETFKKRPDLLKNRQLTIEETRLLDEAIKEQEQGSKK
jgi:tRNA (guanine37-N1)-methyltransferase